MTSASNGDIMTLKVLYTVVLSVFGLALVIFLMLFILLAFGKINLSDLALGALATVMVSITKLIIPLINHLGTISEVETKKPP
jgi:hypothetical protein